MRAPGRATTCVPAHLHRRHAAGRGQGGHRVRPARPRRSWTRASCVPDDVMIGIVDERLAETDTHQRGLHPRRLPAHRRRRPRRSTGITGDAPARRRDRPRGARARSCIERIASRRHVRRLRRHLLGRRAAEVRLDLRQLRRRGRAARRRHRGGRSARRLDALRRGDRAADRVVREPVLLVEVDGLGTTDEVLGPADGRRSTSGIARADGSVQPSRSPVRTADELAEDAPGRPGRGRDARAHPRGDPAGVTTARPRPDRPRRCSTGAARRRTSSATTASRR